MEKSSKSQASLEYLLIIALTLGIIVPTTYLFYNYSKESSQELTDAQITKLGRSIVDTSETIFYSGEGSKTILELTVPDNIVNAQIVDGREFVFNVTTNFGDEEIVFISNINLSTTGSNCVANVCKLPELSNSGLKKVRIRATKSSAFIDTI